MFRKLIEEPSKEDRVTEPFRITLEHLIGSNLVALESRTLQAQNPTLYDNDPLSMLYSYYRTPDGKYRCGVGCALPDYVLDDLGYLDVLEGFGSHYETDFPLAVLWRLKELHNAWLQGKQIYHIKQEIRTIMMEVLGHPGDRIVDESVYRSFILALGAAMICDEGQLYWACVSELGWMAWSSDLEDRAEYFAEVRENYGRFWWLTHPILAARAAMGRPPHVD